MTATAHDLGWLKRQDQHDGTSRLLGGFGEVVAVVETEALDRFSRNGERIRCQWHCARP